MLSLLLLTCRRGINWTSLRVCLGWLKCMGTGSSMLFSQSATTVPVFLLFFMTSTTKNAQNVCYFLQIFCHLPPSQLKVLNFEACG